MRTDDTIFALATADGPAARAVVRVCGPGAFAVGRAVAVGWDAAAGSVRSVDLAFAGLVCPGWIYCFRAPHSYTGDDTVEFHLPGNPVLVGLLCGRLAALGCRPAGPGEFTARAYFAGKLDLTEAEGVAATIAAVSGAELVAARRLLSGELARRLKPVTDRLAETLALVEAEIDFSDQDVTFLAAGEVTRRIGEIDRGLAGILSEAGRIEPTGWPPRVALVGRPNAGKSSLLNALAGSARAVVSPVAGTTRDVLTAEIALNRGPVQLLDVAGLDADAEGEIDRQMQAYAGRAIETADRVVRVVEAGDRRAWPEIDREADLVVITKIDLFDGAAAADVFGEPGALASVRTGVAVSAVTGEGLDRLGRELDRIAFDPVSVPTVVLNHRHRAAMADARAALRRADPASAELVASDLREALDSLGEVLGAVTPDDVLGRVFSAFCIGK